ncbi:Conserved_hypothetical protein [Hexamita inflata]|uniref:Uncharacterized protein n=1 Tax=Hexamita inflata TaxID=28002 RepID=A0AA86QNP5_9EUKA|nr:Conserved hypothetical protein [Hexamita inflata]
MGLQQLADYLVLNYDLLASQPQIVKLFIEKLNQKGEKPGSQMDEPKSRARSAMSTISANLTQKQLQRTKEYDALFDNNDFSYDITLEEQNAIKYGKQAITVLKNRSFRISSEDSMFSNIPFGVYLVHGAPLSGKTTFCKKIQQKYNVKGSTIPIITFDQILGESQTLQKYKKLQEQEQSQPNNKKPVKGQQVEAVDPNAFKKLPEYIDELAQEFCSKLNNYYEQNNEQYIKLGLIIDGLHSQYVDDVLGFFQILSKMLQQFMKPTLYDKQVLSSRVAFYPILLDLPPVMARKRSIDAIVSEYKDAEMESQSAKTQEQQQEAIQRMNLAKTAMIDAKQYFDDESKVQDSETKLDLEWIQQRYTKINANQDILGQSQQSYLQSVNQLEQLFKQLKEYIYTLHKDLLLREMSDADKSPEQLAYDQIANEVKQTQTELQSSKKADVKKVQQKYDELVIKLQEAQTKLPANPIDLLPTDNLFKFIQSYIPECDINVESQFENLVSKVLHRYLTAFDCYWQVQQQVMLISGNAKVNKLQVVEELLVQVALNPSNAELLKQRLQNPEDEINQILNGSKSLKATLLTSYSQLPDDSKQLFQVVPISSDYMEFIEKNISRRDALKVEVDQMLVNVKTLTKPQQLELQQKQKELQFLDDQCKIQLSQQTQQIEAGFARWIIPAKGSKKVYFRLMANKIMKQDIELVFKSRTTALKIPIKVEAECDWPHIQKDWMNILPKDYDKKHNLLDFGFLRTGVQCPELFQRALTESDPITNKMSYQEILKVFTEKGSVFLQQHFRTIMLENDSVFPAKVALVLDNQLNGEQPTQAMKKIFDEKDDKEKTDKNKDAKKDVKKVETKLPPFIIYPQKALLQPGEKIYAFISSFPETTAQNTAQLYIGVESNPEYSTLSLKSTTVVPSVKYTVPECQTELLPNARQQDTIVELCARLNNQQIEKKQVKKPDPKKPEAKVDTQLLLNIPRISLKNSNSVEIPVTNTSDLPLYVQFVPQFKDENIQSFAEQFKFEETAKGFKSCDIIIKGNYTIPPSTIYAITNKHLTVTNTKFMLKAQETGTIKFEFQSKQHVQLIYPGKLLISQYCNKTDPSECTIPQLQNFAQLYKTPIVANPLVVVAEAHNVDAFVAVTQVIQSADRIPPKDVVYKVDNPSQDINFGVCKALTHFQAEALIINNGPYEVKFDINILSAYKSQLQIIQQADQSQVKQKGKVEELPISYVYQQEGVLAAGQQEKPATKDKVDKTQKIDASAEKNNQKLIKFDYYSSSLQDLQNQAFASIQFSDPTTKQLLSKTTVNITVKVKYSDVQVSPDRVLHFGDFAHGKITQKIITVENVGPFPTQFAFETLTTCLKRYYITGQISQFSQEYAAAISGLKYDKNKLIQNGILMENNQQQVDPKKPVKADPKQVAQPNTLKAGPFVISPCNFSLAPNQKQQITISFSAIGTIENKELFVIDYSNRLYNKPIGANITDSIMDGLEKDVLSDQQKLPDLAAAFPYKRQLIEDFILQPVIRYSISGNSQIPGISAEPSDLFEEQQLVNQAVSDPVLITEGAQYSVLANQLCLGGCQLNNKIIERVKLYNPYSVETNVALIITTSQDPVEQIIMNQIGDSVQRITQFIDQNSNKAGEPLTQKTDKKQDKNTKDKVDLVSNDDEAWRIDKQFVQVLPHESVYISVMYQPTKQVQSRARFIAVSLDTWLRVADTMKKADKTETEKNVWTQLQKAYSEKDSKSSTIEVKLWAVGVLPEVVLGPKFVQMQDVFVNAQNEAIESQQVFIKNIGRVPCKFSIQIKSQLGFDYFALQKSENSSVEPENRLFTGLKEVGANSTVYFNVVPYLKNLPSETTTIDAIQANIMISEDKYSGLEIPLKMTIVKAQVCVQGPDKRDKIRDKFLADVIQGIFAVPDTPQTAYITNQLQQCITEAQCFTQMRQQTIQQLNLMQDKPEYKQLVFLKDTVPTDQIQSPMFLTNQSSTVQRFEIDNEQQKKLNIEIVPSVGHINPNSKIQLMVKMLQPQQEVDPKAKKQIVQNRNILFGTPLLIKLIPIHLKKYKAQSWDNSQQQIVYLTDSVTAKSERKVEILAEPEYDVIPNQQVMIKLQKELEDLQSQVQKKVKLQPPQIQRMQFLSKTLENQLEASALTASYFVEANLFGCYHVQTLKFYFKAEQQLQQITPQQINEQLSSIDFPFQEIPILQSSSLQLLALNDGLSAPETQFIDKDASAFKVVSNSAFMPRPDLFATAVKEQYPTITENAQAQQILTKIGVKGADKNFITTFAAKFTNPELSPYVQTIDITYEPRIPGTFDETFISKASALQLHFTASASLPLCHIECALSKYLQLQRPASLITPYIFSNLLASNSKAVKVLQINSVGIASKSASTLSILNTIAQSYEIHLQRLPESSSKIQTNLNQYVISSGEKMQLKFTYEPDRLSLKGTAEEAFYIIKIPAYDIKIPLLVVGIPQEPDVGVSTNKINFGPVGFQQVKQLEVQLINKESTGFNFKILPNKSQFEVKVTPSQGIVPAKGQTTLLLTCNPSLEGKVSEIVQIEIAKKSMPLQLNVKYECFKAKHQLELLPENEQVGIARTISNILDLDLGSVFVADSKQRVLKITNVGSNPLQFTTELKLERIITTARRDTMELRKVLENVILSVDNAIQQQNVYQIDAHTSALINIKFAPKEALTLDRQFGLCLYVKVPNIGAQRINIYAKSQRPGLQTDKTELDYGIVLTDLAMDKCQVTVLQNYQVYQLRQTSINTGVYFGFVRFLYFDQAFIRAIETRSIT